MAAFLVLSGFSHLQNWSRRPVIAKWMDAAVDDRLAFLGLQIMGRFWAEHFSGKNLFLGGGFKYVLFSPLFGEDFQFDWYFSDGLKPPTSFVPLKAILNMIFLLPRWLVC